MLNGRETAGSGKLVLHGTALVLAVIAVFGVSLFNGFVWDDTIMLINNPAYHRFDLRKLLFTPLNGLQYLPLRDVTLVIDYSLWGKNPFGFHLTNIILYAANVFLVYLMCRELLRHVHVKNAPERPDPSTIAFMAAILFAVMPLHSEVVSWVSCRGYLVAGIFFFSSLILYLRFLREETRVPWRYYVGALVCYLLSLLSMPHVIILPLILLLFVLLAGRRNVSEMLKLTPFFAAAVGAFIMFRAVNLGNFVMRDQQMGAGYIIKKTATAIQIPFFYLYKMTLHAGLSPNYPPFATGFAEPTVLMAAVVCITVVWVAVRYARMQPLLSFCLGWYLAALLPVLNIFATKPVVADRYAFFPSVALCLAVPGLLAPKFQKKVLVPIVAVVAMVSASLAFTQNRVWRTEETLWLHSLKVSPSYYAYCNLGDYYFWKGEYDKAFPMFLEARRLSPGNNKYDLYAGYLMYQKGEYAKAAASLESAAVGDDALPALYYRGLALLKAGNPAEAAASFSRVLQAPGMDTQGFYRRASRQQLERLGTEVRK